MIACKELFIHAGDLTLKQAFYRNFAPSLAQGESWGTHSSAIQVVLLVGDLTYSDAYHTNGVLRHPHPPTTPYQETYQPRWDSWGRMMSSLAAKVNLSTCSLWVFNVRCKSVRSAVDCHSHFHQRSAIPLGMLWAGRWPVWQRRLAENRH